jgi:peroxiredoxin
MGPDPSYTCANSSLAKTLDNANFRPVILLIVPSVSTALCIDLGGRAVPSTLRCIQSLVGYDC